MWCFVECWDSLTSMFPSSQSIKGKTNFKAFLNNLWPRCLLQKERSLQVSPIAVTTALWNPSVSTQSMHRVYLLFMSVYDRNNCPFILQHILLFYITTFMFMFEYDFCIYLWVHMSVHLQEGPKLTLRVFSFILYFNRWGRISVEVRIASSLYPGCPIAPDILSLHLQCWDTSLPNIYLDALFWTVIFMIVQQMHYH